MSTRPRRGRGAPSDREANARLAKDRKSVV